MLFRWLFLPLWSAMREYHLNIITTSRIIKGGFRPLKHRSEDHPWSNDTPGCIKKRLGALEWVCWYFIIPNTHCIRQTPTMVVKCPVCRVYENVAVCYWIRTTTTGEERYLLYSDKYVGGICARVIIFFASDCKTLETDLMRPRDFKILR